MGLRNWAARNMLEKLIDFFFDKSKQAYGNGKTATFSVLFIVNAIIEHQEGEPITPDQIEEFMLLIGAVYGMVEKIARKIEVDPWGFTQEALIAVVRKVFK